MLWRIFLCTFFTWTVVKSVFSFNFFLQLTRRLTTVHGGLRVDIRYSDFPWAVVVQG